MMYSMLRLTVERVAVHPNATPRIRDAARRKVAECDRAVGAITGRRRVAHAVYRTRGVLGSWRRGLQGESAYFAEPPPEVAAAFPDLSRL